jgi:hypothetical protein
MAQAKSIKRKLMSYKKSASPKAPKISQSFLENIHGRVIPVISEDGLIRAALGSN